MKWSDNNGKMLYALSKPIEIVEELNSCVVAQGIMGYRYYLHSEQSGKTVISNVPSDIYKKLQLSKYVAPNTVSPHIRSLVMNLKEYLNIVHNNHPDAATTFANGKAFQLNQCRHNSTGIFFLINHLASIEPIKIKQPVQIVLGYVAWRIPFGTKIGNAVIEHHSIWLNDWHIWNYVEEILVDMSLFKNGNLFPSDSNIPSWGTPEDHVFIFPPEGIEYWGVAFDNIDKFNKIIDEIKE